jgi:trehalose-phosphatase
MTQTVTEPYALLSSASPRLTGSPLLVMLDVDGTLAPIARHPALARVPRETQRILALLARKPGVHLALVSGRAADDVKQLVSLPGIWIVGNHGVEVLDPDGHDNVDNDAAGFADAVSRAAAALATGLADIQGIVLENKRWSLSVHYRMAKDALIPLVRNCVEEAARESGLRVMGGRKVYELRPPVPVNKGTAILALARHLGATDAAASLLFAGDDVTDEDGFTALRREIPSAVTICVGSVTESAAEFRLPSTTAMRAFLGDLVDLRA